MPLSNMMKPSMATPRWWAAETWGTHSQQGTVTADRISELLRKLLQEQSGVGGKRPLCRLQIESSGLIVDTLENGSSVTRYPLDDMVFCHVDSALPDAIVWVVRQQDSELCACVFKCEHPGAAICLYTTFNELHRRNKMESRKWYQGPLVGATTTGKASDSYGRIRAQLVQELRRKLCEGGKVDKRVVVSTVDHKKDLPQKTMTCETTTGGDNCCCWRSPSDKCSTQRFEKLQPGGAGNNLRKQSNGWPVSSVVKKLLNKKKTPFPDPEAHSRRVLPSGGYATGPSVPVFWSPPPIRTGFSGNIPNAILLPVLPPTWVTTQKPRLVGHQGTNGRTRLLRRRGSTGSDNVDLVPVWASVGPVFQDGAQMAPRSVMKKKAPPVPLAAKKNVTFHAFATVQVMN